jgi:hypothetical protein
MDAIRANFVQEFRPNATFIATLHCLPLSPRISIQIEMLGDRHATVTKKFAHRLDIARLEPRCVTMWLRDLCADSDNHSQQIVFCETMFKSKPPNGLARVFDAVGVRKRSGSAVKVEQLLVLATRRQKALLIRFRNVVVVPWTLIQKALVWILTATMAT